MAAKGKSPVRVFLKWITGLLFFVVFSATAVLYSLYSLTMEDAMVPLVGRVMASVNTSAPGASVQNLTAALRRSPSRSITPFTGIDSTITLQEIEGRSDEEIRVLVFSKLAGFLYREGVDKFFARLQEPVIVTTMKPLKPVLRYATADFSGALRVFLSVPVVVSSLLLLLLVLLSYRFGKMTSPGVVFIFSGLIGIGIFSWFSGALRAMSVILPGQYQDTFSAFITGSASVIIRDIGGCFFHNFLIVFYTGCALLAAAFFGKFLYNIITGKSESENELRL
jgi:hypothetical protein